MIGAFSVSLASGTRIGPYAVTAASSSEHRLFICSRDAADCRRRAVVRRGHRWSLNSDRLVHDARPPASAPAAGRGASRRTMADLG